MNPARKEKNGRGRNGYESIGRDRDILWKTFYFVQLSPVTGIMGRREAVETRDFPCHPQSSDTLA
jgi:hypothetical protein